MMLNDRRLTAWLVCLAGLALATSHAQLVDEDGLVAAEDVLIEEALNGHLPEIEEVPLPPAEPAGDAAAEASADEEALPADELPMDVPALADAEEEGLPVDEVEEAPPVFPPPMAVPGVADGPAVEDPPAAAPEPEPMPLPQEAEPDLDAPPMGLSVEAPPEIEPPPMAVPEMEPPAGDEPAVAEAPPMEVPGLEPPAAEEPPVEDVPPMEIPVAEEPPVEDVPPMEIPVAEEPPVEDAPPMEIPVAEEPPVEDAPPGLAAPVVDLPPGDEPPEDLDRLVEDAFIEAAEEGIPEPPAIMTSDRPPRRAAPPPAVSDVPRRKLPDSVAVMLDTEKLRRQAFREHAETTLVTAEQALRDRNYVRAIQAFEVARDSALKAGETEEVELIKERARAGLAESYYRHAELLLRQRDFGEADRAARNAAIYLHPKASKLIGRIKYERERPKEWEVPPPPPKARWEEPEYQELRQETADLLRRGRQHLLIGEYDQAQGMFERVLSKDPYNTEAIRLMSKVNQRKFDASSMENEATRREMISDVRSAWNRRDYAYAEQDFTFEEPKTGPVSMGEDERLRILDKMRNIVIPEIEFRQANINDVIGFLHDASIEFDPSEDEQERKGVNIILNLGGGGAAAQPAAAPAVSDPWAEEVPGAAAGGGAASDVPLITFTARRISLLEALRIVTQVTGLKYRIEGSVVMMVPFNAPEGDILVRVYDVLPSVVEKIEATGRDLGGGFGGGDFQALEGTAVGTEYADWKQTFADMGMRWPEGSSIKHVPTLGKLVVANTAENLTVFEQVLDILNVVPKQIEIEARFVEVNQTDLDSLGVEWMLTDAWELAQKKGQDFVPLAARQRIVVDENAAVGGFTKGNRFLRGGVSLGGTAVDDDLLRISAILTNPELTMVLHAIQQRANTDLLSAPKITTQNETEAEIKVVTEYIYPTDFEVTPITGRDADGVTTVVGGIVEPSGFETREVGVILSVLPRLSQEGQMIELTLTPEVVSEPTWRDYGSVYVDPDGREQRLPMQQPFFHTRHVSTTISIYNGATVVMGGMINEARSSVDDKVPLLGDIPLLGRLFRSTYENSEKRNLLIFVTARLVDPAGRAQGAGRDTRIAEKILSSEKGGAMSGDMGGDMGGGMGGMGDTGGMGMPSP